LNTTNLIATPEALPDRQLCTPLLHTHVLLVSAPSVDTHVKAEYSNGVFTWLPFYRFTEARGAAVVDAMRTTGASAEFLHADMGDAEDICALAEVVLARGGSIDMLIHSAGGMPPPNARTCEGVDRGFAQNFLGAFLLTRLLEERLLTSAPARVIAVGSGAHRLLKQVDLVALMRPSRPPVTRYQMGNYQMRSYQAAKLAVATWI
jgi:NAD(P)-dependent dehydrogenase (short-subunit alcohol dehydrogenase family)